MSRMSASARSPDIVRPARHDEAVRVRPHRVGRVAAFARQQDQIQTSTHLIAESPALQGALQGATLVARTETTVLLLGETGVGKDLLAKLIHERSERRGRQMVRICCGAMPATLVESQLFGHERGAFTDALTRQLGCFEVARGSTLFLDEIGELPAEAQVKLLRVLEERVIERLGSYQPVKVDVRIIAATNRNLDEAVASGRFRADLFYRLNVFQIVIPPLRERVEDIPALAWNFVQEYAAAYGKSIRSMSEESMTELRRYTWPGNVRELRNVVERAVILAAGPELTISTPKSR